MSANPGRLEKHGRHVLERVRGPLNGGLDKSQA